MEISTFKIERARVQVPALDFFGAWQLESRNADGLIWVWGQIAMKHIFPRDFNFLGILCPMFENCVEVPRRKPQVLISSYDAENRFEWAMFSQNMNHSKCHLKTAAFSRIRTDFSRILKRIPYLHFHFASHVGPITLPYYKVCSGTRESCLL